MTLTSSAGTASLSVVVLGPPNITDVSPNPAVAGGELAVECSGLDVEVADIMVTIDGIAAPVLSIDGDIVVVEIPAEVTPGLQSLVVVTPAGQDSTSLIIVAEPPAIASVEPSPLVAGSLITITGTHLHGALVQVAGVPMMVQSTSYDTVTGYLGAQTPTGTGVTAVLSTASGVTSALVEVSDGSAQSAPSITTIAPVAAEVGMEVTVSGSGLFGASVTIDGLLQPVVSSSELSLVFTVAVGTPVGEQAVVVSNSLGSDTVLLTVESAAPIISSVEPSEVEVGGQVTITGNYLGAFTSTTLGGKQSSFAVSDTTLVFTVAGTPTGLQNLTVTTDGGEASAGLQLWMPVQPPLITDVSPQPATYGDVITILGDHLASAAITIGGVPHTPIYQGKSLVTVLLDGTVLPGDQAVVATVPEQPPASASLLITPLPPVASLVYVTAISDEGRVGCWCRGQLLRTRLSTQDLETTFYRR